MNQSFKYNGLTIEVREERGLDLIDRPQLNRVVLDYLAGQEMAEISSISKVVWNRILRYTEFLQVSTVSGKGFTLPTVESPDEEICKGYHDWTAYIDENPECYRQWTRIHETLERQVADPQPSSAETPFDPT